MPGTPLERAIQRARRLGRRARSIVRRSHVRLVYHPRFAAPPNPFSDPQRATKILDYLVYQGCIARHTLVRPQRATIAQLNRVHPWSYLTSMGEPEVMARIFGERVLELPARDFVEQQRWMTGGTLRAAKLAVRESTRDRPAVAVTLGGGLHHADADGGFGFAAFNDLAVAIAELRAKGFDGHILIVDLDVHQGDGTRRIFAHDETVTTLSIHDVSWDTSETVHDIDVALGHAVGDATLRSAIESHLPAAFERFRPQLVFYVAGTDVALGDPVGTWRIGAETVLWRDQRVVALCEAARVPLVWTLGGGYGSDTWRLTARSLAWLTCDFDASIPSETERFVERFRGIARKLGSDALAVDRPGARDDFDIDLSDLFDDLRHPGTPSRLLGYYTRYGIEVALEEYGVLARVREVIGDVPMRVEIDLRHATGQLVRLVTDDGQRDILIELVVDERHDVVPSTGEPLRLLWLEWLLVQNPRAEQAAPMPGQDHPGLGISRAIIGMLLMSCERLGYDGIAFNPAHYHVAALGARAGALFVDPVHHARFAAMKSALTGLELPEASHLVESERLRDQSDAPARWTSGRMVLPSSARLTTWLESEAWRSAVAKASQSLAFECADQTDDHEPTA